jgi:PPM family protein phosphatase
MVVPSADSQPEVRWRSAALSDRGLRRDRNEDAFLHAPDAGIYAVADGMGGHAAGDVASRIAVETLAGAFAAASAQPAAALAARLAEAFTAANDAILRHADLDPACTGMGTTLTALTLVRDTRGIVLAHIGDSRAYRLRSGELTQLTRDHTWVQQQVEAGMLTARAARHHRLASVLNRVLGTAEASAPQAIDIVVGDVLPGDLYLLCSDGLSGMIEDADLLAMLMRGLPLAQHADELVAAANVRGGVDNVTVVLLQAEAP